MMYVQEGDAESVSFEEGPGEDWVKGILPQTSAYSTPASSFTVAIAFLKGAASQETLKAQQALCTPRSWTAWYLSLWQAPC